MASVPDHVRVVVVTYGDRAGLCQRVVEAAFRAGARDAVVVDNASAPRAVEALRAYATEAAGPVTLVEVGFNSGSAGGFARGLTTAMEDGSAELIWLLDDDNAPDEQALGLLVAAWRRERSPDGECAVLAYRDRSYQRALASGQSVASAFPSRSSFLSINVRDAPARIVKRLRRRTGQTGSLPEIVELPYAPYGGLLLTPDLIRRAGLPDERFWIYEDDADFTSRVREAGGRLLLVPAAHIDDLDTGWYESGRGGPIARLLDSEHRERLYFMARNRTYFERTWWLGRSWLWSLNRALVMTALRAAARTPERRENYRIIRSAVADGVAGRLGERGQPRTDPQA